MEFVGVAELELEPDVFDVDFKLTLGGGSLSRLMLSLGGGGGGGGKAEGEDGVCGEVSPFVGFFGAAVLLVFPLRGGESEFITGGGGMTRLGPFIGRSAVLSTSGKGVEVSF